MIYRVLFSLKRMAPLLIVLFQAETAKAETITQTFSFADSFSVDSYTGYEAHQSVNHSLTVSSFDKSLGVLLDTSVSVSLNSHLSENLIFPSGGAGTIGPNVNILSSNGLINRQSSAQIPFGFQSFNSSGPAQPPTGSNITADFIQQGEGPYTVYLDKPTYSPQITIADGISYGARNDSDGPETVRNLSEQTNIEASVSYDYVQPGTVTVISNAAPTGQGIKAQAGAITAVYTPPPGYTTQALALATGYAHFNWLQIITGFSYNGIATNVFNPYGTTVRATGLDPLIGQDGADNFAAYWDEGNFERTGTFADYNWKDHTDPTQFIDMPNLLKAGWSAFFSTYLIGVKADGTYDLLDNAFNDPELSFRWKYTQIASGGSVEAQNIDPALAGDGESFFLGYGATATPVGAPAPVAGAGLLSFFGAGGVAVRRRARRMIVSMLSRRTGQSQS